MRPATLVGLSEHYGAPAPDPPDGSFETFIRLYRAAAAVLRTPDDYVRLVHEAMLAVEDGAFGRAVPLLERVIAGDPGIPIAQLTLGVARARQRQFAHVNRSADL